MVGMVSSWGIRSTPDRTGPSKAEMGVMSVFVNAAPLSLLVAMACMACISALITTRSIQEEDAGSAWVWAGVFAMPSLLLAWYFRRLV